MSESNPSSTWFERLLLNLLSYSIVLVPVACIVLATRYKLCPNFILNSVLVRRFVFGSTNHPGLGASSDETDGKLLLVETKQDDGTKRTSSGLSPISSPLAFAYCFFGLQISYLIWGVLQEKIMTTKYPLNHQTGINKASVHNNSISGIGNEATYLTFHDSQFLVFVNRITAFIISICVMVHNRPKQSALYSRIRNVPINDTKQSKPQVPLYEYIYSSLSNILSSWCQLEALKFVNFPTQVLSKSCKIVPVMLMSGLLMKRRYPLSQYLSALLLSLGMFIFLAFTPNIAVHKVDQQTQATNITISRDMINLEDMRKNIHKSPLLSGLLILILYLTFDSFTANWQQSLFTRYEVTKSQMMAATNFYSIMLTLTSLYQLGNLKPALKLLSQSNALLFDCLSMSIMSSVGQFFVYLTIQQFGSVTFATIMTMRQAFAILLSCTIYGHPLSSGSIAGLALVFLTVGHQIWSKAKESSSKQNNRLSVGTSSKVNTRFNHRS